MQSSFLYTYAFREEERALCQLEMRAFFGFHSTAGTLRSTVCIDPSRSPFMKERIKIQQSAASLPQLQKQLAALPETSSAFKVVFVKNPDLPAADFSTRQQIAKEAGAAVPGTADIHQPNIIYAIFPVEKGWIFGELAENEPVWMQHEAKPHQYSTALSTRMARSIVNIAVPFPSGIRAIDPCCGIGTVLIEAASMGIDITGSDNNPKVMKGLRENLKFFGIENKPALRDMRKVKECYNTAIIDMPYNLCSVLTKSEKHSMMQAARNFTETLVLISIEPMQEIIEDAGFTITDRCQVHKNKIFSREIYVCC